MEKKTFQEKVVYIQTTLKAPKNLYNSFGKYKYRNAEGICEAVKPFLAETGLTLTIEDDIVMVGQRVYVKAIASLSDGKETITKCAYAREAESKTGMDSAQITGAASSYARKYALNGMFLLDDTKDPDTEEYKTQAENAAKKETAPATPKPQPAVQKPQNFNPVRTFTDDEVKLATETAAKANSRDELKMLNESYPGLTNQSAQFKKAMNDRWLKVK